jgi:hypothetical protein
MDRIFLTTNERFRGAHQDRMTVQRRPDQALAVGIEENKKVLLQRNPKVSPLEAHRQAIMAALRDNPRLVELYRTFGREGR